MRRILWVLSALLPAPCAFAADPQPYSVTIVPTADRAVNAAMAASSSLLSLRSIAPVSPFALIGRAQADRGRLLTALHSEGYYDGSVTVTVDGQALDDPALAARLNAVPQGRSVAVVATAAPGPRYVIGVVTLAGDVPPAARAGFALQAGQPARAAVVVDAGTRLLADLQASGHALARVPAPVAYAHPDRHTLDVTVTVAAGPRVALGPITLDGLARVKPDFVRKRLLIHSGEVYSPNRIDAARQDLAGLPVFAAVRVREAGAVDANGQLPLAFDFTERLRHVVALNGAYSTDLGGSLGASWTDRNLFGRAEQLTLSATATELGGSATQAPGYDVGATFIKPDWRRRDQALQFDAIALREYLDSYNRTAETLDALVSRRLSKQVTVSAGISGTEEQVSQEGVNRNYVFVGLPLGIRYDTTDSLLAPIRGLRTALTVTPTESFSGSIGSATYVLLSATGSTYLNLGRPGRSVIALRATLGATEGAGQFDLPPDQRQYAGGSATIRGYRYQYVGPQFPDEKPQGGTSLDAATIEFRQRFGKSLGAAAFVDAGQVGTTGVPFSGDLRAGAGLGLRYYTAIGPIRADVATPLIQQHGAGSVELYIGIGEAF